MSIISQKMKTENHFALTVENFFKKFSIGSILKESNAYKEKGVPCVQNIQITAENRADAFVIDEL